MNELKTLENEDVIANLYDGVELSRYTAEHYMTDEYIARHVDIIADELLWPTTTKPVTYEDAIFSYYEFLDQTVNEMTALLIKTDAELKAAYERCADDYERDELFEENSSMIFDQMSYSGHTDCTQLIPLSYVIRGINMFITDADIYNHFYENFNCYKNVVYSIGDAQNTLFPQFTEQISKEIQVGLGLDYLIDDFVDMRVVAIRKPDNNLRIGGEQSWQK